MHRLVEQQTDPVPRPGAEGEQVPGELVGAPVQLVVGERLAVGVHGQAVVVAAGAQHAAALLEQVVQSFTASPARPALACRAHQDQLREPSGRFDPGHQSSFCTSRD